MPLKGLPFEVPLEPLNPPQPGRGGYVGLNPHSETLPAGWKSPHPAARAIPCDILVEHDVGIQMRDGATLYADILRPPPPSNQEKQEKVPALICWSPFGKKFSGLMSLDLMVPWSLGIPPGTLSGLEKFEAPDPADWVPRGYAIVNVDSRGSGDSAGTMAIMGTQEAEDGYDFVEAVAALPWCSGAVGLAGNSHLAIVQWFVAALRPPHLRAIAPWEGCGDLYREQFARGGIYNGDLFDKLIVKYMLQGRGPGLESFRRMFREHPLANAWWNDKRPDMRRINVPTYITGTWTNTMHGQGALRGWLEVATEEKWLRWHPWQEWYDLWGNPQAKDELMQFFDHYLKGVDNGWEKTPRLRMAVLRFGNKEPQAYENIVEDEFPMKRTEYKKMYLTSKGELAMDEAPQEAPTINCNSETGERAEFTYVFDKTTQIVGLPKAVLYMSCPDYDDMDVYVMIEKLDASGKLMENLNIPWKGIPVNSFDEMKPEEKTEVVTYKGPVGILRASHRVIDEAKSMHPHWPFHPHEKEEKITPGEIVRLDIGIWGMGIEYEAGEALRVVVSGRSFAVNNFGTLEHIDNKGTHKIHVGGDYPSHVVLPFV
ncbi:Alpha/Beta hydrolase protein [Xylariomycetidae sp. FL0641]|nr:Alpha/Beta hydrolase protein [Xylariomycetidae sp. FL0641]